MVEKVKGSGDGKKLEKKKERGTEVSKDPGQDG